MQSALRGAKNERKLTCALGAEVGIDSSDVGDVVILRCIRQAFSLAKVEHRSDGVDAERGLHLVYKLPQSSWSGRQQASQTDQGRAGLIRRVLKAVGVSPSYTYDRLYLNTQIGTQNAAHCLLHSIHCASFGFVPRYFRSPRNVLSSRHLTNCWRSMANHLLLLRRQPSQQSLRRLKL